MASAVYPLFKQKLLSLTDQIDFDVDTIKARLVNITTDYTYNAAHDFINDVTQYSGTTDQTVAITSVTNGAVKATAASETWTAVTIDGTKTVGAVVLYKDTGNAATSPLICYIELPSAITPNGGDITVTWDTSPDYIFTL